MHTKKYAEPIVEEVKQMMDAYINC